MLSSANYHGKIVLGEGLPIPSGVQQIPQHNLSMESPAEFSLKSQRSISSHRVIPHRVISSTSLFPNGVVFSSRFILANHHPQRKRRILLFNISPGFKQTPGIRQGFIFPGENTFINMSHFIHHDTCIYASYHTITFILRTSWHHTFHTSWHCIRLMFAFSGKGQSKDDYYQP